MTITIPNDRIFYTADDGSLHILIPTGELPIEAVIAKDVPAGKAYFHGDINDIPADHIFRDAWKLNASNEVYEDLELSRAIAQEKVKFVAQEAALAAQKAEVLLEPTPYSSGQIATAYASCKTDMQNCTTVADLKQCLATYSITYGIS